MRYVKAAVVGLLGGFLLTAAVIAVQIVRVERSIAAAKSFGVWAGDVEVTFVLGFAIAFTWILRRERRLMQ